jgi:hypothetical protein
MEYSENGLLQDIIAGMPLDYIALVLRVPLWARTWLRLNRLLKLTRVTKLAQVFSDHAVGASKYSKLLLYLVLYIYLNHFAACFMFFIGKI